MDYIRVFYRRRWTAVAVLLVVVLSVTVYTFTAVPIYEARAQILIESDNPNIVSFQEVLDEGQARANYYETQYELLRSRALARKTLDALNLWTHPEFGGQQGNESLSLRRVVAAVMRILERKSQANVVDAAEPEESVAQSAAVSALLARLQISPVRGSRIVSVRFRSRDPDLAAKVANAHVRGYIEQHLELRFLASKEATDWLSARLAEERKRVEQSESALQAYREQHDGVSLREGQDIVVQKLADLNAAVTRAKTNRIEKEAAYRQLLAIQNDQIALDSFPAILGNPFIQQLKVDLARLQREHAQLSETLGDRHPDLSEKRSAIGTTERRLQVEIRKVVQSVRNEFLAVQAQEASLTAALETQKREALELNRLGIEYSVLKREAESIRQVYDSLLQRVKETGLTGELRASNIRIVDAAEPPRAPASPRKRFNLMMAFLSGSLLAIGFAFFFEYLDDRLKTPDDLKTQLGVPFLGLIPKASLKRKGQAPILTNGVPPKFAEALRVLRTNLFFSSAENGMRSILVTSTAQGEGKTIVASNLAVALAQAQQRVLLVDADMRRPRVHELFGQSREPGLSNLLVSEAAVDTVLRQTRIRGLKLLAAGTPPPNAPELLGSRRFKELLGSLHGRFDWVIIDSPPVMAVTDASVVAHGATGVVFVVGADMTGRRAARLALEQLEAGRGHLVGAVLNRVDLERNAYYYSPYYRREYGQGYLE